MDLPAYVTKDYLVGLALQHGKGNGTPGHRWANQSRCTNDGSLVASTAG